IRRRACLVRESHCRRRSRAAGRLRGRVLRAKNLLFRGQEDRSCGRCAAGAPLCTTKRGLHMPSVKAKTPRGRAPAPRGGGGAAGRGVMKTSVPARQGMIRATALGLLVLVATGGCGALTGRPLETWAQDRGLTARVKARLAAADAGTLTRIHVDTYESIVYLTGGVASTEMKRHAEEIARGGTGVEQVVNNLHLAGANALAA